MPLKIAIHGAAGRMGQRLIAVGHADIEVQLVAALESDDHPQFGQDAGLLAGVGDLGLPLCDTLPKGTDAIIDFSVPDAASAIVARAVEAGVPLVVATTGFSDAQQAAIEAAAKKIPVVWAPSMSTAVNVTMKLTEIAAQALKDLPSGVDVEILERHHRFKEDAPSGTALRFGQIVADAMGHSTATHGREGRPGIRPRDEIGYHAIRTGDNPGEHTIVFGMLGETIELKVAASGRDCYAHGAYAAAKFAAKSEAGMYGMADVLGI